MSIHDYRASLDLKQNLNIYTTCKQLDNLNLILTIFDNSLQADLTNYDVRLKAIKSDQVPLIQEHTGITINNNIVTISCHEQLTTTAGNTLVELQFINKTTALKKATFNLVLQVYPSSITVNNSISTATYTLLQELENKLDQAVNYFEDVEKFQKDHPEILNLDSRVTSTEQKIGNINVATDGDIDTQLKQKSNQTDLINGSLRIAQRYNSSDTTTFTNPNNKYIMDRFRCNGTGTVVPIVTGGCTVTGTINFKYIMEKIDFIMLPNTFKISYGLNGVNHEIQVDKSSCTLDNDGNATIFNLDITNSTLNYVHYGKGPFIPRPYAEELALCKRYYRVTPIFNSIGVSNGANYLDPFSNLDMRIIPTVKIFDSQGNENKIDLIKDNYSTAESNKEIIGIYNNNGLTRVLYNIPLGYNGSIYTVKEDSEIY